MNILRKVWEYLFSSPEKGEEIVVEEEDCYVIMYIEGVDTILYVFYNPEKREIVLVEDIDSCSRFALTSAASVGEVLSTMVLAGMVGIPCLVRTTTDDTKRVITCISMSMDKLLLFSRAVKKELMN